MTAPLKGVRVLDLSRILAGPWSSQILADMGAEVIKIERPGAGDDTRHWGPPFLKDEAGEELPDAAYYLCANRGKKSLTLDITSEAGQQVIRDLAKESDIFLENYKVGGLAKYGLDYASMKAVNPRLIYCSITGFGQDGPMSEQAGYDFMIQGMGGLMSVTGEKDELPGGGPQKVGVALADVLTGMYATTGILGALYEREQSGEGQHVDLALLDVQVASLANQATNYLTSGNVPQRLGNAHPNIVPYQAFATSDSHLILAVGNDGQFQRFCKVAGAPELAEDERYASNRSRVANRVELCERIAELVQQKDRAFWLSELDKVSVPCGPINNLQDVFENPQVQHRGMKTEVQHPSAGEISLVGSPIKYSRTPVEDNQPPPELGEHTDEVLESVLGYSAEQVSKLKDEGVL